MTTDDDLRALVERLRATPVWNSVYRFACWAADAIESLLAERTRDTARICDRADCARECADVVHETLRGYKPQRHAQVDADVKAIEDARAALRAALAAEPAQPVGYFIEVEPGRIEQAAEEFRDDDVFPLFAAPQPPADAIREAVLAEREAISKFCADVYEKSASRDDGLDPFENGIKWTTEQISSWIEKRGAA